MTRTQCRVKTSPASQEEIKRIYRMYSGRVILALLTIGQERILTQLTYLALFSQPIYFLNAHFLQATDYYICFEALVNCNVVS